MREYPLYLDTMDSLPHKTSVCIVGANDLGMQLLDLLCEIRPDIRVRCFVDSRRTGSIDNQVIRPLEFLRNSRVDTCLLCPESGEETLASSLSSLGVDHVFVFHPEFHPLDVSGRRNLPCHRERLYMDLRGNIHPCEYRLHEHGHPIGHASEHDIVERIWNHDAQCSCEQNVYRPFEAGEARRLPFLAVEAAPPGRYERRLRSCGKAELQKWTKRPEVFKYAERLVQELRPEILMVMGEIIQRKNSMDWLRRLLVTNPFIRYVATVTHGCYPLELLELVGAVFQSVTVELYGFQASTCMHLAELDLETSLEFVESLMHGYTKIETIVRYMLTPENLHEAPMFLNWAIRLGPPGIHFGELDPSLVNLATRDNYWLKTLRSVGAILRSRILNHAPALQTGGCRVVIPPNTARMFGIDETFVQEKKLGEVLYLNCFV